MECQVCTTTHLTLSKWKTWADDRTRISSKNCQKSQIVTFRFHYLDSQKKKKPSIDIIMCEIALELCTFTQKTKQFCIVKSKAACWLLIQGIHDNSWIYMTDIYRDTLLGCNDYIWYWICPSTQRMQFPRYDISTIAMSFNLLLTVKFYDLWMIYN